MKKASEKFIEYYEEAEGNDISRFHKACTRFQEAHQIMPPYSNFRSFASAYRYHQQTFIGQ